MFHISGQTYEVIQEHKNAWNPEAFRDRYSEVLERYDYIVGDWGYNQLRLKGFFRDNHPKSTKDTTSSGILDYINEYCNFGCAYFIVEKLNSKDPRYRQSQDNGDEEETHGAAPDNREDAATKQGISLQPKVPTPESDAEPPAKPAMQERKPRPRHRHKNRGHHSNEAKRSDTAKVSAKEPRPPKDNRS
ncbi:YutD family protein [Paenibacillus thiaminolyticus]|uniref:DUF1027 domain-containing protein n=1 Tax=Paenibacillus thiaminolyticus TaxID=49283 RepID=A0A3A3GCC1_PANTH|nr:YutD family protein [Paenibacillus thiaminolyticus]RJG20678.1 DUF1027 domain-containing protein [Paenibacillus thiaminolyticus]